MRKQISTGAVCGVIKGGVDAVEVTRCADCQHCALEYEDQGFGYPSRPTRVCIIHDHETKLDDYCSWARRKDGADNEYDV